MTIRIKKNSYTAFGLLVALLLVLVFIRYAFSVEIPKAVLTAVLVAIAVVGNKNELMAVALCCIPMHEAVDFYTSLALCAIIWVVKYHKSVRIGYPALLCMGIVVWETMHFFLTGFDLRLMITSLIPFVFLAVILSSDISDIDYVFIVRAVAIVSATMGFMLLLNVIVNARFNLVLAFANMQRLGHLSEEDILNGGAIHPNTLGIINVLSITGLMQLRALKRSKKTDYVVILLLIILGALTASRTFFVCLLTMGFFLIVGEKGSTQKKLRMMAVLTLVAAVSLLLLYIFFPSSLEYYIGRFFVEDITTGRDDLMVAYHRFMTEHLWVLLFGVGLSGFGDKVVDIYRAAGNTPHNNIQEILVAWGIPGLLMMTALVATLVLRARSFRRRGAMLNYIPLIIILVKSLAGQMISSGYTVLALVLAYLSLCQSFAGESPKTTVHSDYNAVPARTLL